MLTVKAHLLNSQVLFLHNRIAAQEISSHNASGMSLEMSVLNKANAPQRGLANPAPKVRSEQPHLSIQKRLMRRQ